MENINHHPLIELTDEDVKKVRQFYDLDDVNRINESLDAIEEWCMKQPHLAEAFQHFTRDMLERMFILSRGSVERTKIKIDKCFTLRGMSPEISLNKSVDEFDDFSECITFVPLPKLCPTDLSRVMVTQISPGKCDEFNLLSFMRYVYLIGEYRLSYDYSAAERFIFDFKNANMSLVTKINPIYLKKADILASDGYGTKIKGIHIVNAPSFVDTIISILKQGVKEKIARRFHVHNTYEDLHKEIVKEILPIDYGGDGPSCAKLAEQWRDILKTEDMQKIVDRCNKMVADESKRSVVKFNEEYLGMPGSFRQLTVD